jgi:hypothetical protein
MRRINRLVSALVALRADPRPSQHPIHLSLARNSPLWTQSSSTVRRGASGDGSTLHYPQGRQALALTTIAYRLAANPGVPC